MNILKRILLWLWRIVKWFFDGWLLWLFITVILTTFFCFKNYYLIIGNGLQLIGVVTIVIGINSKIRLFNKISPFNHYLSYFKKFPSFKPKTITTNVEEGVFALSGSDARFRIKRRPDESFQDIIKYIDDVALEINHEISDMKRKINSQMESLNTKLSDTEQKINTHINQIEQTLKSSSTSNIDLELFGAGCIAAGLIFSILGSL